MDNNLVPKFVLAAEPKEELLLPDFFSEENVFYKILKDPPGYLRYMGWNLLTLDTPKIREGKYWEVTNGERKKIRLFKDGSLVAVAYADNSFLGWGQDDVAFYNSPRINTVALIEYIYEFVNLYKTFIDNFPQFEDLRISLGFKNSTLENGKKLYLRPAEVGSSNYMFGAFDGKENLIDGDFYEVIPSIKTVDITRHPDRVAFNILAEIAPHFGIPTNKLPYTEKDNAGQWRINVEKIKSLS